MCDCLKPRRVSFREDLSDVALVERLGDDDLYYHSEDYQRFRLEREQEDLSEASSKPKAAPRRRQQTLYQAPKRAQQTVCQAPVKIRPGRPPRIRKPKQ